MTRSAGILSAALQSATLRALVLALVLVAMPAAAGAASGPPSSAAGTFVRPVPGPVGLRPCIAVPAVLPGPVRVELEPTRAGAGMTGSMELSSPPSPFGIAVSADGRHVYDLRIRLETQRRGAQQRILVAWVATPELDRRVKLGVVGDDLEATGRVDWNKFMVLVTAEASADVESWQGPVLLTGLSPSGRMHTMAGHGIFEAGFGYC